MRNIKPRYQGLMLSFSRNDPNQRYYLNGMWTCGPPVMIVNFLCSNEKVALYTVLLTPSDFKLNIKRTTILSNFNDYL